MQLTGSPQRSGTALTRARSSSPDIGPTGSILQSGCDIPVDAPLENVKAMAQATEDAAG